MTLKECVEFLYGIPKFTKKNPMSHTKQFLEQLGNPQEEFQVIHVAGSNGKGSTCSFLSHILMEAGCNVGLFCSPHLVDIRERFLLNGCLCSEEDFLEAFRTVRQLADRQKEEGIPYPTFFEFLFAMGQLIFRKNKVDYVILETGLGGRLDATNVVSRPIMTIITSISLEHTEYLGNTIEEIAREKAGIIKPGAPVIFDGTEDAVAKVILQRADEVGTVSYRVLKNSCRIVKSTPGTLAFYLSADYDKKTVYEIPSVAHYQILNATLAILAVAKILPKLPESVIQAGLRKTKWNGRMQEVYPDVFLDGAHNPGGISVWMESVRALTKGDRFAPILLFSMVREKDYQTCISCCTSDFSWERIIVTRIEGERGLDLNTLRSAFPSECAVDSEKDYKKAFQRVLQEKKDGQKVFCCGSLYLIGALLNVISEME